MSVGFGFSLPALAQYGGGGNNPFGQLGPTLDLSFVDGATGVTDLFDPNGYTLNTNFIAPEYQVAAQYTIWETNVGLVSKTFSQIITFTRASTVATYFNSAGVLTTASTDVPRFDYNPVTLVAQGLLIEEARTNSIRNNTMVGAVAGTPGTLPTNWTVFTSLTGLTSQVVGTGTENGITYLDFRLSGTPSAAGAYFLTFESTTQVAASSGQVWTSSAYYKLQSGSLTGVTTVSNAVSARSAVGADLSSITTAFTPTTAALNTQRVTSTITSNPASTAFETQFLRLDLSGVAIDITLRIGLPQLEQGAFATSVIPTTTTAVLRAADVASVNTLSPWYNASTGTIYTETFCTRQIALGGTVFAAFDNGTSSNLIRNFGRASGTTGYNVIDGGVTQADLTPTGVISANTTIKIASAYAANDFASSGNGGAVVTDTSGTVPSVSNFKFGFDLTGGNYLNGYLRRIVYYPRRLTDLELRQITLPTGATITTQDYSFDSNFTGNTVAIGS